MVPAQPLEPPTRSAPQLRVNPTAIVLAVAIVGSIAYFLYAITVRDASQIPLLASGALVLGLVFGALAMIGLRAAWQSSVRGRDGRALGHALVGGIASFIAAGCLAGAIILAMLSQAPQA